MNATYGIMLFWVWVTLYALATRWLYKAPSAVNHQPLMMVSAGLWAALGTFFIHNLM